MAATQPHWLAPASDGGTRLCIHVQPGAARSELAGTHGDALKIRIAAAAVEGAANAALIEFLAGLLKRPRREVTIVQGERSRRKIIHVRADPATVERCLGKHRMTQRVG